MKIHAYAALAPKALLTPYDYESGPLGGHEVTVKIAYCGVCYSDIHLIDNDWETSVYPQVPGHEIIGHVVACGKEVKNLTVGACVGIGWQRSACGCCEPCRSGEENYCGQKTAVCEGYHGGYADFIQIDSRFALPIPPGLDPVSAGPLLCGGATVYTPLYEYASKPGMKIAVIGVGGLGHLAIQFAAKMGHEVTAFSSSADKEAEARSFGAMRFVNSKDSKAVMALQNSFDLILCTVHANLQWDIYVNALRPHGKLCFLGAVDQPLHLSVFPLILGGRSVCGSSTASPLVIEKMLAFAAHHHITPKVEVFPMEEVNTAIAKVRANEVHYRAVLKV